VLVVYDGALGGALEEALRGGDTVARAASVQRAESTDWSAVDVLVVQRCLPDGDGLALAEHARAGGFVGALLVVASGAPHAELVETLRRGADDCVREPVAVEELVARVHALGRRSLRIVVGPLCIDTLARRAFLRGEPLTTITRRELDVLTVLARHPGWTPAAELARRLFTRTEDALNHVQVTVSRIRGKLGQDAPILESRRGLGYRLRAAGQGETPPRKVPRGTLST